MVVDTLDTLDTLDLGIFQGFRRLLQCNLFFFCKSMPSLFDGGAISLLQILKYTSFDAENLCQRCTKIISSTILFISLHHHHHQQAPPRHQRLVKTHQLSAHPPPIGDNCQFGTNLHQLVATIHPPPICERSGKPQTTHPVCGIQGGIVRRLW